MYITADTIIKAASLLAALGALAGAIVAVYKVLENNRKQNGAIKAIQTENTLICYGVLACLKGLKEQGCDGPVTDALNKIEKHLNENAHRLDLT